MRNCRTGSGKMKKNFCMSHLPTTCMNFPALRYFSGSVNCSLKQAFWKQGWSMMFLRMQSSSIRTTLSWKPMTSLFLPSSWLLTGSSLRLRWLCGSVLRTVRVSLRFRMML